MRRSYGYLCVARRRFFCRVGWRTTITQNFLVDAIILSALDFFSTFGKTRLGRCNRFHQKIVDIGGILAVFRSFPAGNLLLGMSCLEHRECLAWKARNVLPGIQGMSCVEHRECPAWNTRNVFVDHGEFPVWNTRDVLLATQGASCLAHKETVPEIVQCTVSRKRTK